MAKEKKINKKSLNVKNLLVAITILILLMAGAYYYFFSNLRVMGETISNLQNDTDSLVAEEGNLDSLRVTFSDTTDYRQKINSYFIQSDGAIDFITTIENLATFANLTHMTESVDTQEENPKSPSRELLHLTFKTTGSWQNTFYFISLLESLPFNVTIHGINLHATGQTTTESALSNPLGSSATTSSSTPKKILQKGSVWESTYNFSVLKLK